ncbi:MAG TPA: RNA polymerase sigma factor [Polyangiaceae bacterium]
MPALEEAAHRVAKGDLPAFRIIVEACSERLVRLGARMLGNVTDAEDLVQEGYLRALRALQEQKFDGRSSVETWLHRIVANLAVDQLRARKRRAPVVESNDEMLVDTRANSADTRLALRELDQLMSCLAAEQRVALILSAMEGFSNAEIAQMMDCTEGSVEQRLVRARATLRQKRNDYGQS